MSQTGLYGETLYQNEQTFWVMVVYPFIPALGVQRGVCGHPGVQNEFQNSQKYTKKDLSYKTKTKEIDQDNFTCF